MKKLFTFCLFFGVLFASDDLINSMHKMEQGLSKIQQGYLYNDQDTILKGIDELYLANSVFKKTNMESYLPKNKKHFLKKALDYAHTIDKEQKLMKEAIKKNKLYDGLTHTTEIIKACASCHAVVRGW